VGKFRGSVSVAEKVWNGVGTVMSKSRAVRVAGLVLVVAVAGLTLRDRLPDADQVLVALRTVNPWFLVLAAMAEMASLRHFALQQRRLLAGFGVGMSIPRAMAVTVSRSAISSSVPAGSAVSAGYAFRQFRTVGASREAAASVTVLSGLLSGIALALLYGVVLVIPHAAAGGRSELLAFVLGSLVVATVVFVVDWRLARRVYVPVDAVTADEPPTGGLFARLVAGAAHSFANLRQVPPQAWMLSLLHAAVNWATDLACLAAVAAAFDLNVSLTSLATVYLTVQLVRQVPISPGGIGVIEVALLAGLISTGSPQGVAAAAVLIYRLLSCWIIIPIGGLAYTVLNRRTRSQAGDHPPILEPGPAVETIHETVPEPVLEPALGSSLELATVGVDQPAALLSTLSPRTGRTVAAPERPVARRHARGHLRRALRDHRISQSKYADRRPR